VVLVGSESAANTKSIVMNAIGCICLCDVHGSLPVNGELRVPILGYLSRGGIEGFSNLGRLKLAAAKTSGLWSLILPHLALGKNEGATSVVCSPSHGIVRGATAPVRDPYTSVLGLERIFMSKRCIGHTSQAGHFDAAVVVIRSLRLTRGGCTCRSSRGTRTASRAGRSPRR
jgi:hypothetical protein